MSKNNTKEIVLSDSEVFTGKDISKFSKDYFTALDEYENGDTRQLVFKVNSYKWYSVEALTFFTAALINLLNRKIDFFLDLRVNFEYVLSSDIESDREKLLGNFYLLKEWNLLGIFSKGLHSKYCNIDDINSYLHSIKYNLNENHNKTRLEYFKNSENLISASNVVINKNFLQWSKELVISEINWDDISNFKDNIDQIVIIKDKFQLKQANLNSYFDNKSITHSVLKELVENSIFHGFDKIDDFDVFTAIGRKFIKDQDSINFQQLPEINNFFKPGVSYLEITNIDFGLGISNTLRKNCAKHFNVNLSELSDSEVIKYSLLAHSSQHEFSERIKNWIPRGLSDLSDLVEYYHGILIIRSGNGIVIVNNVNEEPTFTTYNDGYFNGTMFTLFLPPIAFYRNEHMRKKPMNFLPSTYRGYETLHLGYFGDFEFKKNFSLGIFKEESIDYISSILERVHKYINDNIIPYFKVIRHTILIIDFSGINLDYDIFFKKILWFFCSYHIFSGSEGISIVLKNVKLEILDRFKDDLENSLFIKGIMHPVLCISKDQNSIIGLVDKNDESNLLKFLEFDSDEYDDPSIITEIPILSENTIGNFIYQDINKSKRKEIIKHFRVNGYDLLKLTGNNNTSTLIQKNTNTIFITAGNYFQKEFIDLKALIHGNLRYKTISEFVSRIYESEEFKLALQEYYENEKPVIFCSITLSSHILCEELIRKIEKDIPNFKIEQVKFPNYWDFHKEENFENLSVLSNIFLVCDVVSTGGLLFQFSERLREKNLTLKKLLCLIDARKKSNVNAKDNEIHRPKYLSMIKDSSGNILELSDYGLVLDIYVNNSLDTYKISKIREIYKREGIKEIKRVSPYTNSIIEERSFESNKVLFKISELPSVLENYQDLISINYFKRNNQFHTYYFKTHNLFKNIENSFNPEDFVLKLLDKLEFELPNSKTRFKYVVFPKDSGIEHFNFKVLYKHNLIHPEMEVRPIVKEKTPEDTKYTTLELNVKTNTDILLIDDGSCTGATLMQMLLSIRFKYGKLENPDIRITILSIFGRMNEYQKDFFSSLESQILNGKIVKIDMYYGFQFYFNTYFSYSFGFLLDERKQLLDDNNEFRPKFKTDYAEKRLEEIKIHKEKSEIPDYHPNINKYKNNGMNPLKLLQWRSELGKIGSFNVYKDYFDSFNDLIIKNDTRREKGLEYLLIAISHEKFLIKDIKRLLPDIFYFLKDLVRKVIFEKKKLLFIKDDYDKISLFFDLFEIEDFRNLSSEKQNLLLSHSLENFTLFSLFWTRMFDLFADRLNDNYLELIIGKLIEKKIEGNIKVTGRTFYLLSEMTFYRDLKLIEKQKENFNDEFLFLKHFFSINSRFYDHRENLDKIFQKLETIFKEQLKGEKNFKEEEIIEYILKARIGLVHLLQILKPILKIFDHIEEKELAILTDFKSSHSILEIVKLLDILNSEIDIQNSLENRKQEIFNFLYLSENFRKYVILEFSKFQRIISSYRLDIDIQDSFFSYVLDRKEENLLEIYDIRFEKKSNIKCIRPFHEEILETIIFKQLFSNISKHSNPSFPIVIKFEEVNGKIYLIQENVAKDILTTGPSSHLGTADMHSILGFYGYKTIEEEFKNQDLRKIYKIKICFN